MYNDRMIFDHHPNYHRHIEVHVIERTEYSDKQFPFPNSSVDFWKVEKQTRTNQNPYPRCGIPYKRLNSLVKLYFYTNGFRYRRVKYSLFSDCSSTFRYSIAIKKQHHRRHSVLVFTEFNLRLRNSTEPF